MNCSPRLLCPWDSSGNDTGVGCHSWRKCKIIFQKSVPVGMQVSSLGRLPLWFGISVLNSIPRNKGSSWEASVESLVRSALQCDNCLFCPSKHCWALPTQYCSQVNNECRCNFPLQEILQVAMWVHSMCVTRAGTNPRPWWGIISIGTDAGTSSWNWALFPLQTRGQGRDWDLTYKVTSCFSSFRLIGTLLVRLVLKQAFSFTDGGYTNSSRPFCSTIRQYLSKF